ncbi:MAG: hypothetical protein P9L94_17760 [Candidatus Hinthialibacter antarcticus]|nr:hypothetical protein [Candidatus Hinthialibacter antarcticus]
MMKIDGELDAEAITEVERTISLIRSQGSVDLLWIGEGLGHVQTQELNRLTRTFRIYRQMGGRIVLAAFPEPALRAIERTTWKRFINVFKTVEDAKIFLRIPPEREQPLDPVGEALEAPAPQLDETHSVTDENGAADGAIPKPQDEDPEGKDTND